MCGLHTQSNILIIQFCRHEKKYIRMNKRKNMFILETVVMGEVGVVSSGVVNVGVVSQDIPETV